ncbi:MAG: alpha/beta fold hydrolase [Alteromonadaceae bacterium]|nr:alpha/beta fold hydrolase [Alteromonadaceae bacterium]
MKLVNYKQMGEGSDVILIHGLFGSLDNLNMVAKSLCEQFKVTSIDVRNHGNSFHENNMDYAVLAQDLINLLDHLNIEQTDLLGHSMGGKIAIQTALTSPHRIRKLIVADISPVKYPPHHSKIIEGLKAIDLSLVRSRKDADEQLAAYVDNAGVRQFLLRNLMRRNEKYHFKCNLAYIDDCYSQIMQGYCGDNKFEGKTLFIKGGDSDYIQQSHRPIIGKILPNSKARIIQGAGHWLHAEKTVAFNKIVANFLAE